MNRSPKGAGRNQESPPEPKRNDPHSPSSQDWLGDQLRALYGTYAEEPLPEELKTLLDRLDDSKPDGHGKGS